MLKQESKSLNFEPIAELMMYPALFVMPLLFFWEIVLFMRQDTPHDKVGAVIMIGTILTTAAFYFPFVIRDYLAKNKLPVIPLLVFLMNCGAFSFYFYFLHYKKFFWPENASSEPYVRFGVVIVLAYALLSVASVLIARKDYEEISDHERPLSRLMAMFFAQSLAFSTYFVIFRSFESFRLPQATVMQISLSLILVLFLLSSMLKGRLEFRKNPFNLPVLLITALTLFSIVLTPSFMTSVKEFTQYFFVILNFYLLINVLDSKKYFNTVIILVILFMGIEAALGVWQLAGLNELIKLASNYDPFSTLGNKNYVAEMLAMTIPFCIAVSVAANRIWVKALVWLALELMLMDILCAVTRGSWIGVMVSTMVLFLFAVDRLPRRKAVELVASLGGLIVSSLLIMHYTWKGISLTHGDKVIFRIQQPPISYSSRFMSIINIMSDVGGRFPHFWAFYLLVFVIIAVFIWFLLRRKSAKLVSIAVMAVIMAIPAIVALSNSSSGNGAGKETTLTVERDDLAPPVRVEDSIVSRRYIWGSTFEMIRHHPMGVGLGAYKVQYLSELKSFLKSSGEKSIPGLFKDVNAKEAHSEYLHIWAEMGPLAPVLVLFFGWVLFRFFVKIYYESEDIVVALVSLGCFGSMVSIATSATIGFPFHIIGTSLICGFILCLLVLCHDRVFNVNPLPVSLPGYDVFQPGLPEPAVEKIQGKKKKKKRKEAEQLQEKTEKSEPPDETWKKHWHVMMLPLPAAVVVLALGLVFFAIVAKYSFYWQMANIDVKTANFVAKDAQQRFNTASRMKALGRDEQAEQVRAQAIEQDKASMDLYNRSLRMDPWNGDIHLFLGMYYQNKKEHEKALDEFLEAKSYYDLPQIALDLGAIYFDLGKYDEAEKYFMESLDIYPNYPLPRYNLGLIYYQKGLDLMEGRQSADTSGALTPEGRKEKAIEFLLKGEQMFGAAFQINPALDTASFKLALTYEKLNQLDPEKYSEDKALVWYQRTINKNPRHADAYYNRGLLLAKKSGAVKARADSMTMSGRQEEAKPLYASYTQMMNESGEMFDKTLAISPNHVKALNNRGNQLFNEGRVKEALAMYQRAVNLQPGYANALMNLALAYVNLRDYDKALPVLETLITKKQIPIHEMKIAYMLGTCYEQKGNLVDAQSVLSRTIQKYSATPQRNNIEFITAATKLAQVEAALGNYNVAESLLKGVIEVNLPPMYSGQTAEAMFSLANTYKMAGRIDEAAALFRKVLDKYPGSPYSTPSGVFLRKYGRL